MSINLFFRLSRKPFLAHSFSTLPQESHRDLKKFEDIPGPKGPLKLGNLINYLPLIGKYTWLELHKANIDKYNKYGSIIKETMLPGTDIIWLYDPDDISVVLNEKEYPQRRSHLALEKYRKDRPHIYKSAGLLPTNGPEWWRLRSEFQKQMSVPSNVRSFLPDVDDITKEFVDQLKCDIVIDMLPELARLNLELTCLLTFDVRMDSFSEIERHPKSRTSRLIQAAENTNSSILPTDQGFLWRYFETPTYRKLRKAQNYMENVAVDLVSQRIAYFQEDYCDLHNRGLTRSSFLEEFLKNPNLDLSDLVGMAADMLLAGIDTSSYSTSFAIYHLAKNPNCQNKLYEESRRLLKDKNDLINVDDLKLEISYARAVLKEVFRLNPISVGVGRILNKDCILSGYNVPKGSCVVTQNMIACQLEKNFKNPKLFDPDRWIDRKSKINPYLVLPFGHGMRACIARRLAEQNILILLLRLVRNYEIIWTGADDLGVKTLLINKPNNNVDVILKRRKEDSKI